MKQTISKITLITGLLFTNVVKSQEFYTCVPKEDWVKNVSKASQRSDEEIRNLARQVRRTDSEIINLIKQHSYSNTTTIVVPSPPSKSEKEICCENKQKCLSKCKNERCADACDFKYQCSCS